MTTKRTHAVIRERIACRLLLVVLTLAFSLWIAPPGTASKLSDSNGESRFTALDGARIHYKSYGKGSEGSSSW